MSIISQYSFDPSLSYYCYKQVICGRFTKLHYLLRYQSKTEAECLNYEFELTDELLLDINNINALGWTPLMLASANNYAKMVHRLLAAGANPNSDNNSDSCLSLCFVYNYIPKICDINILKMLLTAGANPNWQNHCDMTILDCVKINPDISSHDMNILLDLNIKITHACNPEKLKYYNSLYTQKQIIKKLNEKINMLENKINELSYLPPDIGGGQYLSTANNFNKN